MSERSNAWYAVPANRECRRVNMNAYMAAMVQLGRRYPAQRRQAYQRELRDGLGHVQAYQRGLAAVRPTHKTEFRELLAELRTA